MKAITSNELFNKVENILDDNFISELDGTTFETIQSLDDLTILEIEGKLYDGYWAWTSGGISINMFINLSFLLSTGFYNSETEIGKWIIQKDNEAHEYAKKNAGVLTSENEDDYFELYDDYISELCVWFDIRFVVLKPTDVNYKENVGNGKTYISLDFSINDKVIEEINCTDLSKLDEFIKDNMKVIAEKFNELV